MELENKFMDGNKSILGNLFLTTLDFMNHISDYGILTDEQCIEKASNKYGVDVTIALDLILEKEFCKVIIENIKKII